MLPIADAGLNMPAIERRPNGKLVFTLRITLDPERNARLVETLLAAQPRRLASLVVQLMLTGLPSDQVAGNDLVDEDDEPLFDDLTVSL